MSGLCTYEFANKAWGEFWLRADQTISHPDSGWFYGLTTPGELCGIPQRELITVSSNVEDQSAARYVGRDKGQGTFSTLSNTRNMSLEQCSWSPALNDVFPSSSDSNSMKEVSILASDSGKKSSFISYNTDSNGSDICENDALLSDNVISVDKISFTDSLSDVSRSSKAVDFFETSEQKGPSDFLYYGLPDIGSFDDIDRMFRNCDSTFGLGDGKDGNLNWLSSADDVAESGNILQSDFEFLPPDIHGVEDISVNLDSSNIYPVHDSGDTGTPIVFNDSSWSPEKSDFYMSLVNGSATVDNKDGLTSDEKVVHKKQMGNQHLSERKRKTHYSENVESNDVNELPNEIKQCPESIPGSLLPSACSQQQHHALGPDSCNYLQNPVASVHQDTSHLLYKNPIDSEQPSIKYETADFRNPLPMQSSHMPIQLQSKALHPSLQLPAIKRCDKNNFECLSYPNSTCGNARTTLNASIHEPDPEGNLHSSGSEFENQIYLEGVSPVTPAGLGTSNLWESLTMSSGFDDIAPEAASFLHLHHVLEQLDLKMKLCIRDSLYRLAQSAELRHNHTNQNSVCGGGHISESLTADEVDRHPDFPGAETGTNPVDRTVAHLLFHKPPDATAVPGHGALPSKAPTSVCHSLPDPPLAVNNSAVRHGKAAKQDSNPLREM